MIRLSIIPLIILFLFSSSLISYASVPAKIFYVSKDGNDSWSGTLPAPNINKTDGPFARLDRARDAIRNLKIYGSLTSPVTVQVRGGTYYLDKPFTLEARDSGTKGCPIIYMAYPGEKVILSGGKKITETWKPYNDKIIVCSIPEVKEGKWYFRQLFVNGERQTRACTPDTDFYRIAKVSRGGDSLSSFFFHPKELKRWTNLNDVEIVIFHSWDESRLRIADLDEQINKVVFTGSSRWKFDYWASHYNGVCARYIVENVFEGLDSPGEWYLNRQTGELYYYPESGIKIEDAEVVAPVLNQLLLCKGDTLTKKPVQYVKFSGFTLCDTDWKLSSKGYAGGWGDLVKPSAVTFSFTENCTLENCRIINVGNYGIELSDGSVYNVINKNEVSYTGSGGVRIESLPTRRNTISNNHVHHCGIIYPSGVGICMDESGQNNISHNHVHDISYCGLTVRGPENIVEYNHVHHVMQRLCDGAGIYMFGNTSDGTLIRNNIFHDIYPYAYFGWGIYLDERTEHVTVMNNIVYRTLSGGTMIHGGRYNFWENNIFVDSREYQIFWNTLRNYAYKNIYEKNIFYYTNPQSKLIYVPGSWTFDAIEKSDYNLFFCKGGNEMLIQGILEVLTFEQWQKKGFDFHSIVADPLFVDSEHDNYTLKENSPAFKLGFQQIDVSTVGPQE